MRVRSALARSRHPMLLADDQRRWVTGNAAACDLLGIAQEAVPWHTIVMSGVKIQMRSAKGERSEVR